MLQVVISFLFTIFQRMDGKMQRFIREVNTTSRSCVLWDLEEETNYIIQVQSIGLYGESQASKRYYFKTLKKTDRFPSNSSNQGRNTIVNHSFRSFSFALETQSIIVRHFVCTWNAHVYPATKQWPFRSSVISAIVLTVLFPTSQLIIDELFTHERRFLVTASPVNFNF